LTKQATDQPAGGYLEEFFAELPHLPDLKIKAEKILDLHRSEPSPSVPLRLRRKVREHSAELYARELTDDYKSVPAAWNTARPGANRSAIDELAHLMSDEILHPDALSTFLANRREIKIEIRARRAQAIRDYLFEAVKWKDWLFRSWQVKAALEALDELQPVFEKESGPIGGARLGFDAIKRRVRTQIIEHPDIVRKAIQADTPRNCCLRAITRIIYADLCSGQDHVYRGMLSMAGEAKLAAYRVAMGELEKAGTCTAEDRQSAARELEKEIREMG
jgi:hypothetical protein